MTKNAAEIPELLKKFKHQSTNYVKFHEVDSFQVVHNAQYLLWSEIARVEYCNQLGISILPDKNRNEKPFSIYLVHSEINYFNPASFFDKYTIFTRVSRIGRSSITFESIIMNAEKPLCMHQAVEVYVDKNMQSTEIDNSIRQKILNYEHPNIH